MEFFSLVILFLRISSTLQPLLQARYLAMQRARQIATNQKERNSRVITMIHPPGKRVEVLLEPLVGRHSGIDRAAN